MTTIHQTEGILVITKGAVEVLLDKIDEHQKPLVSAFERKANEVANEGYGYWLCHKRNASVVGPLNVEEIESSLTFIGFAGMIDPRNEAKGSFSAYKPESSCNDYRRPRTHSKSHCKAVGHNHLRQRRYLEEQNGCYQKEFSDIVEHVRLCVSTLNKIKNYKNCKQKTSL
jgi:Ca2+-transporting ATPase